MYIFVLRLIRQIAHKMAKDLRMIRHVVALHTMNQTQILPKLMMPIILKKGTSENLWCRHFI